MKRNIILLSTITFLILSMPAYAAKSIEVQAMSDFNSTEPTEKMKVMALEKIEFENGIKFENGTIIEGYVIDVKQPKRAKLNASFKFHPTSYTYNGKTTQINDDLFIAKYKEKKDLNKGELALSAASTASGFFLKIPGLSQGISLLKGMVKNPEDNRLKSGVVQVYKDSPLSYVEEGKDIVIKKEDIFYLKFKTHEAENLDETEELPLQNEEIEEKQISDVHTSQYHISEPVPTIQTIDEKPKNISTPHPDEVLEEVELNTK